LAFGLSRVVTATFRGNVEIVCQELTDES